MAAPSSLSGRQEHRCFGKDLTAGKPAGEVSLAAEKDAPP